MKLTPEPTAVFSLDSSQPQHSSTFTGAVALKQGRFFSFEPQTRVFGYTPSAAKGKGTHGSLDAENVPSLAAVSITLILRADWWTYVAVSMSDVLTPKLLAIDFLAVSDAEDQHQQTVIFDLADEPVITHAVFPELPKL